MDEAIDCAEMALSLAHVGQWQAAMQWGARSAKIALTRAAGVGVVIGIGAVLILRGADMLF